MSSLSKSLRFPDKPSYSRSNGFRLLNLPDVALKKCLRLMTLRDQVRISLCSPMTKSISSKMFEKATALRVIVLKHILLWLSFREDRDSSLDIIVFDEKYPSADDVPQKETLRVGPFGPLKPPLLSSFWKDTHRGAQLWIEHFTSTFNAPLLTFHVDGTVCQNYKKTMRLTKYVNFPYYTDFNIGGHKLPKWKLDYACAHAKTAPRFERKVLPARGYKYYHGFDMDFFNGFETSWITLECVWKMKCEEIFLRDSSLSEKDLNKILKRWLQEGFPNLLTMQVERTGRFNEDVILEGMELLPTDLPADEWFLITPQGSISETLPAKHMIMRKNGRKAEVTVHESEKMPGHGYFHLRVCDPVDDE